MARCIEKSIVFAFGLLLAAVSASTAADITRGQALYTRYCASCHGAKADGHGPVAPALKPPPSDLRILSKRYGNPLPEDQIAAFIDGRADVLAHGPRDMPVWGERVWAHPEGSAARENAGQVTQRIADLVAYLQSIQKIGQQAALGQPLSSLNGHANR
jgi:mono/diheme cytochrome c family protein